MTTWYKAEWSWTPEIRTVEVVNATEQFVTIGFPNGKQRREAKRGDWYAYAETRGGAAQHLRDMIDRRVLQAAKDLDDAQVRQAEIYAKFPPADAQ